MIKIVFCAVIAIFPTILLLTWMRESGVLSDLFSIGLFGMHAPEVLRGFVFVVYGVFTVMLIAAVKLGGDHRNMGPTR